MISVIVIKSVFKPLELKTDYKLYVLKIETVIFKALLLNNKSDNFEYLI